MAVVDLLSRHVFSWKLSNSLGTEVCMEALEMALAGGRKSEIVQSELGCQITSGEFVAMLQAEEVKISWTGRRRCFENMLVE